MFFGVRPLLENLQKTSLKVGSSAITMLLNFYYARQWYILLGFQCNWRPRCCNVNHHVESYFIWTGISTISARRPLASGFKVRRRAHQQSQNIFIVLCENDSGGSCSTLEYELQMALIISFVHNARHELHQRIEQRITIPHHELGKSIHTSVWLRYFSTLCYRRVPKRSCCTTSIGASSTNEKIGTLLSSLVDGYLISLGQR